MFISKISSGFSVNNYRNNVSFQRRGMLSPLKADTFSFSGKVQEKSNEPQLKEKTIYIFLGPPASGKGTQAEKLAKKLNIAHISTGDLLREEVKNETKLGLEAREYMNSGRLVPTELFERILVDRISQKDCQKGYILDGFPRTVEQAKALDAMLPNAIDVALSLEVPDENIIARLTGRRECPTCKATFHVTNNPSKTGETCDKCGAKLVQRADDCEETIRNRMQVYHEQTEPIKDYYKAADKLVCVNGVGEVDEITKALFKALNL